MFAEGLSGSPRVQHPKLSFLPPFREQGASGQGLGLLSRVTGRPRVGFPELLGALTTRRDPRDTKMSSSEPKTGQRVLPRSRGFQDVGGGGGWRKQRILGAASPPRGPQALGHPVCALMSEAGDAKPRQESEEALVHALKATCLEPGMRKPLLSGPRRGAGQRPRRCPWQPYVPSHWAPRYPPP